MTKKAINNDVLLANIINGIEEVKGNDIDICLRLFHHL